MAVMELGSFATGVTGNQAITLNGTETPTYIEFWTGPPSGSSTANLASFGCVDITNGNATFQSNYTDSTGSQTKSGVGSSTGSSCIQHYNRVSGTLTKVVDWKFVSAASGTFTVNVVAGSSSYSIFFRVFG